jgi:hypothetical protein
MENREINKVAPRVRVKRVGLLVPLSSSFRPLDAFEGRSYAERLFDDAASLAG